MLGLPSARGSPTARPWLARPVRPVLAVGAGGAVPYRCPAVVEVPPSSGYRRRAANERWGQRDPRSPFQTALGSL